MEDLHSIIFEDGEFQATLTRRALSYLSSRQMTGYTTTGLYYSCYQADEPKGLVTIVHGFSEGMYKYREMVYYLVRLGYSCLAYESRGHARSVGGGDGETIHIDTFATYVEDLKDLTEEIARRTAPDLPLYLFGHSMGGCVAALMAEEYPSCYSKVVLSSPMFALRLKGPAGNLAASSIADLMCRLGRGEEHIELRDAKERFETSASTSRERWQYYKSVRDDNILLKLGNPTWSWLRGALKACRLALHNARMVRVPMLVLTAQDDALVDNGRTGEFANRNPLITLAMIPGSRHEIMSSPKAVLVDYYTRILSFLEDGRQLVDRTSERG